MKIQVVHSPGTSGLRYIELRDVTSQEKVIVMLQLSLLSCVTSQEPVIFMLELILLSCVMLHLRSQ
jgi:hypothetical protein